MSWDIYWNVSSKIWGLRETVLQFLEIRAENLDESCQNINSPIKEICGNSPCWLNYQVNKGKWKN